MKWKTIGQHVQGTSHIASGKPCEDSITYTKVTIREGEEVLLCCVSDGAGSALYAGEAAVYVTSQTIGILSQWVTEEKEIDDVAIIQLAERLYDGLAAMATAKEVELNEFSCTFLGCVLFKDASIFFQVGDGAIIREDGNEGYVTIWWPQNGEYSNTTFFLVDDIHFGNLKIQVLEEAVNEIAITTDGLQLLVLNNETNSVHVPFFTNLFKWLRMAELEEDVAILEKKLGEYLSGDKINERTDDDKTLFLATRLANA